MTGNLKKVSLKELRKYPFPISSANLPLKKWNFWRRFVYRFAEKAVPKSMEKLYKIDISGLEHLKNHKEGNPVIFCGNHKSHLDALILATAAVKVRAYLAFMVSGKAMYSSPVFRLLKYLGGFPVFKENPEPALKYSELSLRAGHAVAIFPEGKRTDKKGSYKGKTGVARVIERLNFEVPVIPFYIHGSAEALAIGGKVPLFGRYLTIRFGKAMYFKVYAHISDNYERIRSITDDILKNINQLLKISETDYLEKIEQTASPATNYGSTIEQQI
ncbi:MAG: hypothetical protein HeimC3_35060 [Candidatus Heimdallarchaeota archaeon LC_3]|nr:MAG: hypothetical protein HeimC3_35060 [Candidatus Heimdallarchaeota archaeon LC_3]